MARRPVLRCRPRMAACSSSRPSGSLPSKSGLRKRISAPASVSAGLVAEPRKAWPSMPASVLRRSRPKLLRPDTFCVPAVYLVGRNVVPCETASARRRRFSCDLPPGQGGRLARAPRLSRRGRSCRLALARAGSLVGASALRLRRAFASAGSCLQDSAQMHPEGGVTHAKIGEQGCRQRGHQQRRQRFGRRPQHQHEHEQARS